MKDIDFERAGGFRFSIPPSEDSEGMHEQLKIASEVVVDAIVPVAMVCVAVGMAYVAPLLILSVAGGEMAYRVRNKVVRRLMETAYVAGLLAACARFTGKDGLPPVVSQATGKPLVTEIATTAENISVVKILPTATALGEIQSESRAGYGGELTPAQKEFVNSPRGLEQLRIYDSWTGLWQKGGAVSKDTKLNMQIMPDMADPDNPEKMFFVGTSDDPKYAGKFMTPPIAQVYKYLETGDIDALSAPQALSNGKLPPYTDPFAFERQVDKVDKTSKAGRVIEDGAIAQLYNGEIVYMNGATVADLETVGGLDEKFQYVAYLDGKGGLIKDIVGQVFVYVNGEKIAIPANEMKDGMPINYKEDEEGKWVAVLDIASTEIGQETMAVLDAIGVPEGVVDLKMDGDSVVCIEVATNKEVCRDGEFVEQFVKEAASENAKNTGLEPQKGNVPAGTATDEVIEYVGGTGLVGLARVKLKTRNGGIDLFSDKKSKFQIRMLSEENKSWGVLLFVDRNDPSLGKYFVYEKESGELVIVPIK